MTEPSIISDKELAGEGMKSLVRMLSLLFLALRVLIILMLVYLVFGGMFYVKEHEEAMLFRFGRLVSKNGQEVLHSGTWYWAWPYPIEVVKRIPSQRPVTITSKQFWMKEDPNQLAENKNLPPAPPPPGPAIGGLKPGEEGYVLTGDANILHMIWTLTDRVAEAKKHYLNFVEAQPVQGGTRQAPVDDRGVGKLIESVLNNAVIEEVGTWPVEDVLVKSRAGLPAVMTTGIEADRRKEPLDAAVRRRVLERLEKLQLGIEIQTINLVESRPPLITQQAFDAVTDAATDYQTELATADAYSKRVITEAEGKASTILTDAQAYQVRIVESVKASSSYFLKVLDEYEKNPGTMLVSLYADTVRDVLNKAETKYIIHAKEGNRQEVRLLLGPEPEAPKGAIPAAAP